MRRFVNMLTGSCLRSWNRDRVGNESVFVIIDDHVFKVVEMKDRVFELSSNTVIDEDSGIEERKQEIAKRYKDIEHLELLTDENSIAMVNKHREVILNLRRFEYKQTTISTVVSVNASELFMNPKTFSGVYVILCSKKQTIESTTTKQKVFIK